jgi:hypothetical protein
LAKAGAATAKAGRGRKKIRIKIETYMSWLFLPHHRRKVKHLILLDLQNAKLAF